MIESLNGMHEIVHYKADTNLRLYHNDQHESYPSHWHTPVEIIIPVENMYSVTIGSQIIMLEPTDIMFICPGVIHSLAAPDNGRRIIFQAELTMFTSIHDFESIISLMSPALKIANVHSPHIHNRILNLMLEITEAYDNNRFLLETIVYSKLLEIFSLIGANFTKNFEHVAHEVQAHKEYAEKFMSVCTYINEHCTECLNLDEVAAIAGFSKYHFTRLFKQFTSTTFYKYLNQKRIEHAQKLLADPAITITEAALSSGYTSLSAFIRMFKLLNQCTPTEYRNLFTNADIHTPDPS